MKLCKDCKHALTNFDGPLSGMERPAELWKCALAMTRSPVDGVSLTIIRGLAAFCDNKRTNPSDPCGPEGLCYEQK